MPGTVEAARHVNVCLLAVRARAVMPRGTGVAVAGSPSWRPAALASLGRSAVLPGCTQVVRTVCCSNRCEVAESHIVGMLHPMARLQLQNRANTQRKRLQAIASWSPSCWRCAPASLALFAQTPGRRSTQPACPPRACIGGDKQKHNTRARAGACEGIAGNIASKAHHSESSSCWSCCERRVLTRERTPCAMSKTTRCGSVRAKRCKRKGYGSAKRRRQHVQAEQRFMRNSP
jgi:hypothetical protein